MSAVRLLALSARTGQSLGRVDVADSLPARVRGLLGRRELAEGDGILIEPCSGVHTWFMRFPIDVAFLSHDGEVLRSIESMPPFRAAPHVRGAKSALELPAGTLARVGVETGDRLLFEAEEERVA